MSHGTQNFRPSPNFSAKALRAFAQVLPPCHISKDALSQLVGAAAGRGDEEEEDDNDDDGDGSIFGSDFNSVLQGRLMFLSY